MSLANEGKTACPPNWFSRISLRQPSIHSFAHSAHNKTKRNGEIAPDWPHTRPHGMSQAARLGMRDNSVDEDSDAQRDDGDDAADRSEHVRATVSVDTKAYPMIDATERYRSGRKRVGKMLKDGCQSHFFSRR